MLNILRFVFVLATFEITLSRYLLVRVDQGQNPGTETLVSELQSRNAHINCWNCLTFYCKDVGQFQRFQSDCVQYIYDDIYPYKHYLVNCALGACPGAINELEQVCVDGIVGGFAPPADRNTIGTCDDING